MEKLPGMPPSGNILLVDTDPGVRETASRILTLRGYVVFEARDGHDAYRLSENLGHPLHLLVTDVILDVHLNGFDLVRHLQVARPGLPALYLASVPSEEAVRLDLELSLDAFLSKPFDETRLVGKVEALLRLERTARRIPFRTRYIPVTVPESSHTGNRKIMF